MGWSELNPWSEARRWRQYADNQARTLQNLLKQLEDGDDALEQSTLKATDTARELEMWTATAKQAAARVWELERIVVRLEKLSTERTERARELEHDVARLQMFEAECRHRELEVAKLQVQLEAANERAVFFRDQAAAPSKQEIERLNMAALAAELADESDAPELAQSEIKGFMARYREVHLDGWHPPTPEEAEPDTEGPVTSAADQ